MTTRIGSGPPATTPSPPAEKGIIEKGVEWIIDTVSMLYRKILALLEEHVFRRPAPPPAPVVDPKEEHRRNLVLIQKVIDGASDAPGKMRIFRLFNQYITTEPDREFVYKSIATPSEKLCFWESSIRSGQENLVKKPQLLAPHIKDAIQQLIEN